LEKLAEDVVPLTADDIETVNGVWKYAHAASREYIQKRIKFAPSAGYRDGDKLVSWCLVHSDFSLGMLHTIEEKRGQGYSQKVAAYTMLCLLKKHKILPFSAIEIENIASNQLHKKLGFVSTGDTMRMVTSPIKY